MLAEVNFLFIIRKRKADFFMEETEKQYSPLREKMIKFMPLCILGFVLLFLGLSFIGTFFDVKVKIDGVKTYPSFTLGDILFGGSFSGPTTWFFIITYLIFPLLACGSIFLGNKNKNFYVAAVLLFLLSAINAIVVRDIAANDLYVSSGYELGYEPHDIFFCYALPIVAFFIAGLAALSIAANRVSITAVDITEIGVLIAMALVLNFVKIVQLGESGGSVNFQMLPLMILALRKGPLKGFIGAGITYGLISCLTDGYGIATFPFDYLLGMGSVCILGFFQPLIFGKDQNGYNFKGILFIVIGGILSTVLRFVGGCTSSMIIYGYDIKAAMAYNVLYVFISGAVAIVALAAIYGPMIMVNKRFPVEK